MATAVEPGIASSPGPESSDRSFGFLFAVVFALVACWPLLHDERPRWWALGIAAALALLAIVRPHVLQPLNRDHQIEQGRAVALQFMHPQISFRDCNAGRLTPF